MKRIVQITAWLLCVSTALAQGTFRVVPPGLANVEGNSSSSDLFTTSSRQMVQVYSASEFGLSPGSSGLVTSVAFRLDGATAQSYSAFWPSATVYLSTTTRSPDSLSPVISDNVGADAMQVFGGTFLIRATNVSLFPRFFEVQMPLNTPFWYDPSKGNLAMHILTTTGPASLLFDAQDTLGDGMGRVFGPSGPNSGTVDSLGFVTRFGITEVPEPQVVSLSLLGIALFWAFSSRCILRKR